LRRPLTRLPAHETTLAARAESAPHVRDVASPSPKLVRAPVGPSSWRRWRPWGATIKIVAIRAARVGCWRAHRAYARWSVVCQQQARFDVSGRTDGHGDFRSNAMDQSRLQPSKWSDSPAEGAKARVPLVIRANGAAVATLRTRALRASPQAYGTRSSLDVAASSAIECSADRRGFCDRWLRVSSTPHGSRRNMMAPTGGKDRVAFGLAFCTRKRRGESGTC
jgi:hypothetical protein